MRYLVNKRHECCSQTSGHSESLLCIWLGDSYVVVVFLSFFSKGLGHEPGQIYQNHQTGLLMDGCHVEDKMLTHFLYSNLISDESANTTNIIELFLVIDIQTIMKQTRSAQTDWQKIHTKGRTESKQHFLCHCSKKGKSILHCRLSTTV